MLRTLGPSSGQRTGFQNGLIVGRRIAKGQQLQAGFLTLLLCLLACAPAGATSRGPLRTAGSKAGLLGPARAREDGRILSHSEESSLSKSVAFYHRFGGVKEILSTDPKERLPLWCVAKSYANPDLILTSLNWACSKSGGVDCKPIQPNGSCFQPDTLLNHASYAFNMYYQKNGFAQITCDFDGAATLTSIDPSTPGCVYLNSIVASNNTVYSSTLSTTICSRGCMAAVVGSILLSSIMI